MRLDPGGGSAPRRTQFWQTGGVQDVGGGFKIGKQAFHKTYRFAMTDEVLRS